MRRKLGDGDGQEFPIFAELRAEGQTDYLACVHRFAGDGAIGDMDGVYSSWTTDAPGGFSDEEDQ